MGEAYICFCIFLYSIGSFAEGAANYDAFVLNEGALRAPYLAPGTPLPKAEWFYQKLDHFDRRGSFKVWPQRYFVNSTWWDRNSGPVFLYLNGEGPASPHWIVADTTMMRLAQKHSAIVFGVEHRFYGESVPTNDTSLSSLAYLSSRQALADFASFYSLMVAKYNLTANNKWVCFGGSYAGALSAWFRQLYPDLVVGAVASSAPVLAKVNFQEYIEVVAESLESSSYGKQCSEYIHLAFSALNDLLSNKDQWNVIEKLFKLNPPLNGQMDIAYFTQRVAGSIWGSVQSNQPHTIESLCGIMVDSGLGSPLQRLVHLYGNSIYGNYEERIKFMKGTAWNSSDVNFQVRQWQYQKCTEFGYFKTTSSNKTEIFSDWIPVEYYMDTCLQVFNLTANDVKEAVASTIKFYGGRNITGTNIIFPNGSIDPWHALGVTSDIGESVKAIYIKGTSHCVDMYPPQNGDSFDLKVARNEIAKYVEQWLSS